jgi:DNA invertase Pin-like site-specific DNA recombinase
MRVVGYLRVSTKRQVKGESLHDQREAIEGWAKRHGHVIVRIYEDKGKRGRLPATERPGLLDSLTLLEEGEADCLAVLNLGRLARALHVQEAILTQVWQEDGCAWEAGPDREVLEDDPDDPMRTFVRQVTGAAHQLEGALIVARLQGARRRKAARSGYVGGRVRYGFQVVGKGKTAELLPDPQEQQTLRRVRSLHRSGVSMRRIAHLLNEWGTPTRMGGKWRHTTVRSILKPR